MSETPSLHDELTATERQKWAYDAQARSELIRSIERRAVLAERKLEVASEGLKHILDVSRSTDRAHDIAEGTIEDIDRVPGGAT